MEEIVIAAIAGAAGMRVLMAVEGSRFAPLHRVVNRLKGHRPSRPMRYSGAAERYQEHVKEQERG